MWKEVSIENKIPLYLLEKKMAEVEFSSPDYEILGKLGKGAMGVVLKARHRHEGTLVAIKVISPSWPCRTD